MTRFISIFSLFLFLTTLSAYAVPATAAQVPLSPTSLNVRDFGAKGDGIADDSGAIQRAANAASAQSSKWPVRIQIWGGLNSGASQGACPEIVFPAGNYKISRTIVFGRYSYLRGISNAVISQSNPDQDSFYFHETKLVAVENLHFKGGRSQLRAWTRNMMGAQLTVSHCVFENSTGYAIENRSFTQKKEGLRTTKPWPPVTVDWKDGMPALTPNDAANVQPWYSSTLTDIGHCRFENVMGAGDLSGDTVVVHDCAITPNPQMENGIFRVVDMIHLYRIKARARAGTKSHYWIETAPYNVYTQVDVRNSSFDTEGGGMSLIHANLLPNGTSVVVENTRVKSAGSPENAIAVIGKGTEPNIISVNGVTEISGKPVKAVAWEEAPNAALLERIKAQPRSAKTADIYKIQIANNSPNISDAVPETLHSVLLKPVPAAAIAKAVIPELPWHYADLEAAAGKVLFASDFGVDQDRDTDDTAAIQKVFDAARQNGNALVIFPAGIFTVSRTIQIPPNVVARAAGIAFLMRNDGDGDIFQVQNAEQVAFKNFVFDGGRNGVSLAAKDNRPVKIAFDNCSFYEQTGVGVQALAGKGEIGEANQIELQMRNGTFATMRGVVTNAAHSQIDAMLAINDPRLDNDAFFQNKGGQMRFETILSNPTLWQGRRGKTPANIKDWQLSKNTRWIDNWGKLYTLDFRFGGECGGMCGVRNRAVNGSIYIHGGKARFYNEATTKAILFLEQMPRLGIVQEVISYATRVEDSWVVMNADGSDGKNHAGIIVSAVPAS